MTGLLSRRGFLRDLSKRFAELESPRDIVNKLVKHPRAQAISQRQLIAEAKGIYSGLIMVESTFLEEVDKAVGACSVPGLVSGFPIHALPDTGADGCFISPTLAKQLGATMAPPDIRSVTLASGKAVKPLGSVLLDWKFRGESMAHSVIFHVVKNLAQPLSLGSAFLRATQTLTTYKSRILRHIRKTVNKGRPLRVNLLGGRIERVAGYFNGMPTLALPDTGSEIMVISTDLAVRRGWKVDTGLGNLIQVQFADGSTAFTRGLVPALDWDFGGGDEPAIHDYYVLDELPVDVVLNSDFVLDTDLFSRKYSSFFVQRDRTPAADGDALFCAIREVLNNTPEDSINDWRHASSFTPDIAKGECDRQDQADAEIERLPESEQPARRAAEEKRRQEYETWKKKHTSAAKTQCNSPSGTAGVFPSNTADAVNKGTIAGGASPCPPDAFPGSSSRRFIAGARQHLKDIGHTLRKRGKPQQQERHSGNGIGPPTGTSGGTSAMSAATAGGGGGVSSGRPSDAAPRFRRKSVNALKKLLKDTGNSLWQRRSSHSQKAQR
ncbi:hypothetical protein RB595_009970 [Gaeumannomyces hyphopodioides]